jgi:hypothetical protein
LQKLYIKNGTQGGNPLANILVVIVGVIVIGVTVVLGFFAFLALSAIVLVAGTVIAARVWWARRKLPPTTESNANFDEEVIEGEFHVVKKDKTS